MSLKDFLRQIRKYLLRNKNKKIATRKNFITDFTFRNSAGDVDLDSKEYFMSQVRR